MIKFIVKNYDAVRASFFILAVLLPVSIGFLKLLEDDPETSLTHESEGGECRKLIEDLELKQTIPDKEDLDYRSWLNLGDCYAHLWRYQEALSAFKNAYVLQSSTPLLELITSLEEYLTEQVTTEERPRSFYTVMRNFGPAKHLTGKTVVAYLFIETNQSQWSSLDRQQAISTLEFAQQWYVKQAKNYQVAEPTFVNRVFHIEGDPMMSRFHSTLSIQSPSDHFTRYVVSKLGFDTPSQLLEKLQQEDQADNAMLFLHLNKQARSFAWPCTYRWCEEEYTFILEPIKDPRWQSLHYTIAHEGLHLFGADDLYNIENAKTYATNDIMHYASRYLEDSEIDSLTAYAIGWSDFKPHTPFPIY